MKFLFKILYFFIGLKYSEGRIVNMGDEQDPLWIKYLYVHISSENRVDGAQCPLNLKYNSFNERWRFFIQCRKWYKQIKIKHNEQ